MPIIFDTYLAVVKNGVGSRLFRNFYVRVAGRRTDITKNGVLSCAWFVSSVLSLFKLIKEPHLTVDSALKDLEKSGWKRVKKPKIGSILIWKASLGEDGWHRHIGFYVGNGQTVSNSTKSGKIARHYWTFSVKNGKPRRKVEAIFWNEKLNNH